LVNRLYRQTKGKECGSKESSRLWGGALRDEPKNGCEGDYMASGIALGRVRTKATATTTAMESRNIAAILQITG